MKINDALTYWERGQFISYLVEFGIWGQNLRIWDKQACPPFHKKIILTFLLRSGSLVKMACSTGSPSKVSFFSSAPTPQLVLSWFLGFVSPSASGWLSATAQQICHSVTALNLDSGWVPASGAAADVTRPAGGFHTWAAAAQSQASLLTTQPNTALSLISLLLLLLQPHPLSLGGWWLSGWGGEGGRPAEEAAASAGNWGWAK